MKPFRAFEGKKILSFIRGGDYAHAGEEEAIDLIFSRFPKDPKRTVLDIACGLGKTAYDIQAGGWGKVAAFDIDKAAIDYAKKKYPSIEFFTAAVADSPKILKGRTFDLICIINAFVCFSNQPEALATLRLLAKKSTKLVIFEYTDLAPKGKNPLVRKEPIPFLPIRLDEFGSLLERAGWKLQETVCLDAQFEKWYADFLTLLDQKRKAIDAQFGSGAADYAQERYGSIYNAYRDKMLGGCLLICEGT
jgi:ubiquinone/menaquinone biosynthesis C-methylase UbiE